MKKRLYWIFALAAVCCLLGVCVLPAVAEENDAYYYFKVSLSAKYDGDTAVGGIANYYALHGKLIGNSYEVLEFCDAQGNLVWDTARIMFEAGEKETDGVLVFCWKEPLIAVKLLQEGADDERLSYDAQQYYLPLDIAAQQPGIENAVTVDQMHQILGFKDGGKIILSEEKMVPTFEMTYDAPPVISGADDYSDYYTTQKVTVKDKDLASVTLDGEPVAIENGEAVIVLPGNTDAFYTIVAQDAAGAMAYLTVNMHPLSDLMLPVDGIEKENVKPEDEEGILSVLGEIDAMSWQTENASQEEKAEIDAMIKALEGLLDRIVKAQACLNSENIFAVKGVTAENVTVQDKAALEKAATDLEKALGEYGGNYNDDEIAVFENDLARVSAALEVIEEMLNNSGSGDVDGELTVGSLPETGDNSRLALWLALLAVSGAGMVCIGRRNLNNPSRS